MIAHVVGARPQFIKAAIVLRQIPGVLIHTGQHYDYEMSQIFFDELDIPEPDYNLGVGSASHGKQTGEMLARIEQVLIDANPACVVVYGDTNSTLAGALAACKLHFPIAHVEAGLRSYNRRMPEEHNRVLTDHVSDFLLCPTESAVRNLLCEGIVGYHVGDVMYDSFLRNATHCQTPPMSEYILVTIHRNDNIRSILDALNAIDEPIVFPVHPRTRAVLDGFSLRSHIVLIDPLGYLDMLGWERDARLIITDSGGVQKEAYFWGVPCVTLRNETEWTETVETGWNVLVGFDMDKIIAAVHDFHPDGPRPHIFGDGHAVERIGEMICF